MAFVRGDYLDHHLQYAFAPEPRVDRFGDSPEIANTCIDLVLKGKKRATSHSLLGLQYRGEPLPRIGIFSSWANVIILETSSVEFGSTTTSGLALSNDAS